MELNPEKSCNNNNGEDAFQSIKQNNEDSMFPIQVLS